MNSWHTKRQVNARLVNSTKAHEQIIDLSRPVLLDLLMSVSPTVKDWTGFTDINAPCITDNLKPKINDKNTQRTRKYYSNIVNELTGPGLLLRNEDGSVDTYPKRPDRKDQSKDDERLTSIETNYSLPPYRGRLDTKDYVDVNYLVRLKKYWQSMLSILSEILENYGPIRKEMEWLVYHIVNNDVALWVLFDDLSTEYESRWFTQLTQESKTQIAGLPGIESEPYFFTKNDAKEGIAELRKFVEEFERVQMPSTLLKYKISTETMKKRMRELAIAVVKEYDLSGNYQQANFIAEEIVTHLSTWD
jgi:hypothetical protein